MWPVYLVGGVVVLAILACALPMLIVTGIGALAQLLAGAEVVDDET